MSFLFHKMATTHVKTETSELWTFDDFISERRAIHLFEMINNMPELLVNPTAILYGKEVTMHRTIGFVSDEVDAYSYSGQAMKSISFERYPQLRKLMKQVNKSLNTDFNGILINVYPNGHSYIGAHSDSEKTLSSGCVAGISLGVSRIFRVRNKATSEKTDIITENRQLLVMEGQFQKEFTHEIPKQTKITESRISLTFRTHSY